MQEQPFTIKLEFTEGCNLRCNFCGLQGIRAPGVKDYKFMSPNTMQSIVDQIAELKWTSRFEMALRGEPSMNPDHAELVGIIRKGRPRASIMMTTNGGGLLRKPGPVANVKRLFDNGLNILCLDDYVGVGIVPKIRAQLSDTPQEFPEIIDYPDDPRGNPYSRHKPSHQMITIFRDISVDQKGVHSYLSNHCGAGSPRNDRMEGKRCARPFRELAIRWDGQMMLCCNDWRGEFVVGSVLDGGLHKAWQGARMDAARRKLYRGERDFGPCAGCDSKSYRVGLLPDPAGKREVPKVTAATKRHIKEAVAEGPMTKPHLRPWEGGKD